jgi:hypothetical protein
MTTDEDGNFYVASGWCGGGTVAGGASCVIVLPANLTMVYTFPFQSLYTNPRDISIDNANGLIYISDADMDYFTDNDCIWVMPIYPVKITEEISSELSFELLQNYPNPFNPVTTIRFAIPQDARRVKQKVTLKIYDLLGREVATLVNEEKPAGEYEVNLDGTGLPSGVYFYQLKTSGFSQTKKMILIR